MDKAGVLESNKTGKRIAPKLFLLYISFASMIMFFSALCSAVIVRKGDYRQAWQDITVPTAFIYSTLIIILTSFTIQWAYNNIMKSSSKFFLYGLITFILAIVFLALQYNGWLELESKEVFFTGNPSGSYIYIISLFHGLHYIGGIFFLGLLVYKYRILNVEDLAKKMNFNILTQYWHFIGLVWVFLFLFFKFIIYK